MAQEQKPIDVLVIGTGAVGALYGGLLARAGARVSVVCRSEYDAVVSGGFDIRSEILGNFTFRPFRVFSSVSEVSRPPDYVLVAVKTVEGLDRPALVRNAVGTDTAIVLFGNGIGIEAEMAEAFPSNELISALAFVAASRSGIAAIRHHAMGSVTLGKFPSGDSASAARFAALLQKGGVDCEHSPDVMAARWRKNLWNIAFSPISVLGGGLNTRTMLTPPEGVDLVRRVMREAAAVAAADGYPIADSLIESTIASTFAMAPYKPSMALDHEAGRPMEIDPILGNVLRLGQSLGVSVPTLDALYGLMRMVCARSATST